MHQAILPSLLLSLAISLPLLAQDLDSDTTQAAPWSLELFGGGFPYGANAFQVNGTARAGLFVTPQLEAGLQFGLGLNRTQASGSTPETSSPTTVDSQFVMAGLDARWYPWGTSSAWQPFVVGGLGMGFGSWPIPYASLGLGSHWFFTEQLALSAQLGVNTQPSINPSLGLRYRF